MTKYFYFYIFSENPDAARAVFDGLVDGIKKKGGATYNASRMDTAPPEEIHRVLDGEEPENNKLNWLGFIEPGKLSEFRDVDELNGYIFRYQDNATDLLEIIESIDIPDEVGVQVRDRTAGFRTWPDAETPFSYNPEDDYKTEPGNS